jgi:hypothetical protein
MFKIVKYGISFTAFKARFRIGAARIDFVALSCAPTIFGYCACRVGRFRPFHLFGGSDDRHRQPLLYWVAAQS